MILPPFRREILMPAKCIVLPEGADKGPTAKPLNACPVCVPPPTHCAITQSPSASSGVVSSKPRSGKALRNSAMNDRRAFGPISALCSECFRVISGEVTSSITTGLYVLPQNSAYHRTTIDLFLDCTVELASARRGVLKIPTIASVPTPKTALRFSILLIRTSLTTLIWVSLKTFAMRLTK
jgi:hypothetical protein